MDILQTTVDIKIEVRALAQVPIAPLIVQALEAFMKASPEATAGKFETKAGADITWTVNHMPVDEDGVPIRASVAREVNLSLVTDGDLAPGLIAVAANRTRQ